jgi:glutathione S-transferase
MSADLKPLKLYGVGGINPPKVELTLIELGLPYELEKVAIADVKQPAYTAINPNGRLPALYDPNFDFTIWESGAIIEYLVDRYDAERKISFAPGTKDFYLAKQYLHFQMSGQGPYYGQGAYFKLFWPEKLPSVIERYTKEAGRISQVLDGILAKNAASAGPESAGPWLVGGKFSYADFVFLPWQWGYEIFTTREEYDPTSYPHFHAWLQRMNEMESVKRARKNFGKLD